MSWRQLPNVLTALRLAMVPPAMLALAHERYALALLLIVAAGVSDAVDGFLARRYGWQTRLGAMLDPLADKFLLTASYLTLAWLGLLPAWLAALVVARDLVIIGGALAYHFLIGPVSMDPEPASKLNTLVQVGLVVYVIGLHDGLALPGALLEPLIWIVAASTAYSGSRYVFLWAQRARLHGGRAR